MLQENPAIATVNPCAGKRGVIYPQCGFFFFKISPSYQRNVTVVVRYLVFE